MTNDATDLMDTLHRSRQRFGMARIELGALLEQVRRTEAWRGRAASFGELLDDLCINASAAYQYMRVARRFFFDLGLPNDALQALALTNMSTLDMAARVATADNIAQVVTTVCTLHERDARTVLEEMESASGSDDPLVRPKREPHVERIMRMYRDLPDDQRIDVRNALRISA